MLANYSLKAKSIIFASVISVVIFIAGIIISSFVSQIKTSWEDTSKLSAQREIMDSLFKDGLQIGQALRNVYINPQDKKASENMANAILELEKDNENLSKINKSLADQLSTSYSGFLIDSKNLLDKANKEESLNDEVIKKNTSTWRTYKEQLSTSLKNIKKLDDEQQETFTNNISALIYTTLIVGVIILIIINIVFYVFSKNMIVSIKQIQDGLMSFFAFLNRETSNAQTISIHSNDEFGNMTKIINENITKIESEILEDSIFLEDMKRVVNDMKNGKYHTEFIRPLPKQ